MVIFLPVIVFAQQPIAAKVEMYKGKPSIFINNKPEYPMIYSLTDVPGGRWTWEELPAYNLRNFCANGIKLIQVDLAFDHIWKEDGVIHIDTAQKQLRGVLDVCPDAAIFIRFHVNPPKWWQQKYPEENTVYADTAAMPDINWGLQRIIEDDEENPTRHSLASLKWKKEATLKLVEFLQRLKNIPEANALAGIQVAGGVYGEWHYWGFINNEPDMSLPMLQYFRLWLKDKYKTDKNLQSEWKDEIVSWGTATLPSLDERNNTKAGIFRDPQQEKKLIDYYEAQHQVVADNIIHFCKVIKQNWPRPIITGAFYGYYYAIFGRETAGGHLQLQKVLNSPYIDYLSGPGTYYPQAVEMGDPYRSRSLINSVTLHGKLWLDEMDQQTPLLPLKDTAYKTSLQKSVAQVRRNILFTASKGQGLWFYDFGPSGFNGGKRLNDHGSFGWWDDPALMKDIHQLKKILELKFHEPYESDADVLLVHSTETFYHTGSNRKSSYMGHWANNWLPPAVFRSGVVHDVISVDDMDKINLSKYKCIVFVNTWMLTAAQRTYIKDKIAKGKRHLVWIYAPGYSDGQQLNKDFIQSLTGMQMQTVSSDSSTIITIDKHIAEEQKISVQGNAVQPCFAVIDKTVESLGVINSAQQTGFARKNEKDFTSWFISLPPASPSLWRYIFQQAGATIYNNSGDIFYSGGGILSVHTASGGKRNIQLKNGKSISIQLPSNSTTLLHPENGNIILQ